MVNAFLFTIEKKETTTSPVFMDSRWDVNFQTAQGRLMVFKGPRGEPNTMGPLGHLHCYSDA